MHSFTVSKEWLDYCYNMKNKYCKIEITDSSDDKRIAAAKFWSIARSLLPDDCIIALGNSTSVVGGLLSNGIINSSPSI